jgi:predicted small secreted protein
MTNSHHAKAIAAIFAVLVLSSCGNTIRGAGQDAANAVNATEDAARNVKDAAK